MRLVMAAATIGLFLAAYYWGNQFKRPDSTHPVIEGVLIRPAPALPGFELRDAADHQPFIAEHFVEHWTLLTFVDPSLAPGHLAVTRMIEVRNRLASAPGLQEKLLLVLASQRQDPHLARDFERLSPALKLLSGESGEIQRLREALGAPSQEATGTGTDGIPFYLIGPSGRLLAVFPSAQAPASIASDLVALASHIDSLYPADGQSFDASPETASGGHEPTAHPGPVPEAESNLERTRRDLRAND
ncbi:MAG: hypothetical protein LJE70_17535 [Chromatiaceae bacterium]|nr:hypothetical protein [Chromatiaceae bacterium]